MDGWLHPAWYLLAGAGISELRISDAGMIGDTRFEKVDLFV